MAYKIIYKVLFEVQILHEYFLNRGASVFGSLPQAQKQEMLNNYNIKEYLDIVPTSVTRGQMENYHLKLIKQEHGFFVGIEVNELQPDVPDSKSYAPFIPFDQPLSFSFSLILKNPYFFYFTNLPFDAEGDSIYYFSNRAGLKGSTYPSLALPVAAYEANRAYNAGQLVMFNNKLNEAKINIAAADNAAFDQNKWTELDNNGYVNGNDKTALKNENLNYSFSQPGVTTALFVIEDFKGKRVFDENLEAPEGEELNSHLLKLFRLQEGSYTLKVTGDNGYNDEQAFYLQKTNPPKDRFGVLEIIHENNNSQGDYKLMDSTNDNELVYPLSPENNRKPVYRILLKNRNTVWRYIFSKDQTVTDPNLGDFVRDGGPGEKRKFLTKEPKPITKYPIGIQKFNLADQLLPDPTVRDLKPEADKIYSEIRI